MLAFSQLAIPSGNEVFGISLLPGNEPFDMSSSHHYQGSIDFNRVNTNRPEGHRHGFMMRERPYSASSPDVLGCTCIPPLSSVHICNTIEE